jgi:hypothetical protein
MGLKMIRIMCVLKFSKFHVFQPSPLKYQKVIYIDMIIKCIWGVGIHVLHSTQPYCGTTYHALHQEPIFKNHIQNPKFEALYQNQYSKTHIEGQYQDSNIETHFQGSHTSLINHPNIKTNNVKNIIIIVWQVWQSFHPNHRIMKTLKKFMIQPWGHENY